MPRHVVEGDAADGDLDGTYPNPTVETTLFQPLDSDLTTIAGLTATTDNFIVSVSSAWASRTPTQVWSTLSLNNVDNTSDANKPVSAATQTALNLKANITSTPTISSEAVAPASTPTKIGDIYIDTVAMKLYFAVGTSSSADWIIAN